MRRRGDSQPARFVIRRSDAGVPILECYGECRARYDNCDVITPNDTKTFEDVNFKEQALAMNISEGVFAYVSTDCIVSDRMWSGLGGRLVLSP
jgi:hypothetical protein